MQLLCERRAFSQHGALVVDDVDGNDKDEGDAEEDGRCILKVLLAADVAVEGRCGDGEHAGEEVARPAVAAGCGGGIGSVGANHVVDRRHVDAIICDAADGREDHGAEPVDGWAAACPCEADEADGEAGSGPEEPP